VSQSPLPRPARRRLAGRPAVASLLALLALLTAALVPPGTPAAEVQGAVSAGEAHATAGANHERAGRAQVLAPAAPERASSDALPGATRTDPVAVASAALALGRVDTWPLWLEAGRGLGVTLLGADGNLVWIDGATPGEAPVRIARGLAGEQFTACGAAVLVVDDRGALRRFPLAPHMPVVSSIGPTVSRLHKPACAPDGSVLALDPRGAVLLLSRELELRSRAELAALPDAELVVVAWEDLTALAVLTEPTQRYRHGALGDEVEAGALTLLRLPDLEPVAIWRPAGAAVIEARRPTPWRTETAAGLHVTVSDDTDGARLVSLLWDGSALRPLAAGDPLGASQRWLHLIGARGAVIYALHEPREGGPLVRYQVPVTVPEAERPPAADARVPAEPPPRLAAAAFELGLESHVDGERLLDRAALVGTLPDGGDVLLVPRRGQQTLVWLRCDAAGCRELAVHTLPAALATNLATSPSVGHPQAVVLADADGTVWRLPLPPSLRAETTAVGRTGR
jgi:hypothetical protein